MAKDIVIEVGTDAQGYPALSEGVCRRLRNAEYPSVGQMNVAIRRTRDLGLLQRAGLITHAARANAAEAYVEALDPKSDLHARLIDDSKTIELITRNNTKIDKSFPGMTTGVFSIVAGMTCPGAGDCKFLCYAEVGQFGKKESWEPKLAKWFASTQDNFVVRVVREVNAGRRPLDVVRIHDSGDFYNPTYLQKWLDIAEQCPETRFYCYTKSIHAMLEKQKRGMLPRNFRVTYSWGASHPQWESLRRAVKDGVKVRIAIILAVTPKTTHGEPPRKRFDKKKGRYVTKSGQWGKNPETGKNFSEVGAAKEQSQRAADLLMASALEHDLRSPYDRSVPLFVDGTFTDAPAAYGNEPVIFLAWHGGVIDELDGVGLKPEEAYSVPFTGQIWLGDRWTPPAQPLLRTLPPAPASPFEASIQVAKAMRESNPKFSDYEGALRAAHAARRTTLQIENEHEKNPTRENTDRLEKARIAEGKAWARLEALEGRSQNPKLKRLQTELADARQHRRDVKSGEWGDEYDTHMIADLTQTIERLQSEIQELKASKGRTKNSLQASYIVLTEDEEIVGIFTLPGNPPLREARKIFKDQFGPNVTVTMRKPSRSDIKRKVEALRQSLKRKRNASAEVAHEQADEFINGDAPDNKRLVLKTKKVSALVMKRGVALGKLIAFDYDKNRPGVKGSWFIHEIERKPPTVYIAPGNGLVIEPTEEEEWLESGANAVQISASGPVSTGARDLSGHVADGGAVNKLVIEVNPRVCGFRYAEITFSKNQRPRLDFTNSVVSLSFTRSQWAALPANKRVFFQYRGKNPTGSAGHGF